MANKKPINVAVQASKLKISATITGLDPEINTAGETVNLILAVGGQNLVVPLNPKSFRKVQVALKAGEPGSVMVILTGELDLQAMRIVSAGIVAQVKIQKPDKPDDTVPVDAIASTDAIVPVDATMPEPAPPLPPIVTFKKQRIPEPQG